MQTIMKSQLELLQMMYKAAGKTVTTTEVAKHFKVSQQAAFQRLERMRGLELVTFEYDEGAAGRRVRWTLSEKGITVAKGAWKATSPGGKKLAPTSVVPAVASRRKPAKRAPKQAPRRAPTRVGPR